MSEPRTDTALTDFLLARIAEDEAAAEGAGIDFYTASAPEVPRNVIDHIARFNPVWVGDECEARRRIVGEHDPVDPCEGTCGAPCYTLRYLALPYADHPDFRKGWRP